MPKHTEKNICYFRAGVMWATVLFVEVFLLFAIGSFFTDPVWRIAPMLFAVVWVLWYTRSKTVADIFLRLALKTKRKTKRN